MSNEKKGGNAFKIVIIILLVLIVVGGGAFAGYYFIFSKSDKNNVQKIQTPVGNTAAANAAVSGGTVVSSRTYNLGEFLVNLADEDGKRYIKLTIYVGYESKKLDKEFEEKKPIIRDAVNSVLRAKQSKNFTSKGTDDIKTEILNRINPLLTSGKVDSIYFYDILVQ